MATAALEVAERDILDELLRESEDRLFIESIKDYAIFRLDPQGVIRSWNRGAEAIKGYRSDEILGRHFSLLYTPEDVECGKPQKLLALAAKEGRVQDEGWRLRKDGSRFWAEVVITAVKRDSGELAGYAKVTRDLTRRKTYDDELRRSKDSLAETLYSVGDGVIATDENGRITRMNAVAERLTGWERREALGQPIGVVFDIIDELTRRPAANPVQRVLAEGVVVGLANHTALISRNGIERPIADSGAPIRGAGGATLGAVLVFRDVTHERRVQEALRQSEEKLRLMIDSVQDYAIFMLDAAGRVATWNPGAERIKGYRAEEIIGTHFSRFFPTADVQAGKPARQLELAAAQGRFEEEGWRVRKDGSQFWASVVVSPMQDDSGRLIGFTKVTRDMTDRKRAEELLRCNERKAEEERHRTELAQEAVRERDVFLSVAAHEFRTPLTALQLKLQGLERLIRKELAGTALLSKVETRFQDALRQTDRLSELVERLLDVSRIATGRLEMHCARVELESLVRSVIGVFREKAIAARTDIRLSVAGDSHGSWDGWRLEQVLLNLLSNAIKYGDGKRIDVAVEGQDSEVRLTVCDQGIGIAEGDVKRIFNPFERAAPVEHFAGLGLGLYITKHIVQAHGGRIELSTKPREGAKFTVVLPRNEGS